MPGFEIGDIRTYILAHCNDWWGFMVVGGVKASSLFQGIPELSRPSPELWSYGFRRCHGNCRGQSSARSLSKLGWIPERGFRFLERDTAMRGAPGYFADRILDAFGGRRAVCGARSSVPEPPAIRKLVQCNVDEWGPCRPLIDRGNAGYNGPREPKCQQSLVRY